MSAYKRARPPKDWAEAKYRAFAAEDCVRLLQRALHEAKAAGAPKTAERIRLALSSARGAVRNARHLPARLREAIH